MERLTGKKILLGICGGIAAYKMLSLIRLLRKEGAEVQVVLTPNARDFVGTLSPATLAGQEVHADLFDAKTGKWANHVDLGLWADLFLIAPLTASSLSKMASGQSDNLLLTTYLSARCPVWVAPAMDLDMWAHPTTRRNLRQLEQDGVRILEPEEGLLASGLSGKGRLQEPETLLETVAAHFQTEGPLKGKSVLITLGPTQEDLDPVRFISNHSTGKMGGALARAFLAAGARVSVVAGPVAKGVVPAEARTQPVRTALEMLEACQVWAPEADVVVFCAAVADYRPAEKATEKIKKSGDRMTIELVRNPDIAAELGARKKSGQYHLGFALETTDELENAQSKLIRKNLDAIVLNSLQDAGAGFAHDTNRITILSPNEKPLAFETKSKQDVAQDIVDYVVRNLPVA
jgi:phosphopantothenoylcysteine decarboxylase/phosphopantothenate--cysteine ligase